MCISSHFEPIFEYTFKYCLTKKKPQKKTSFLFFEKFHLNERRGIKWELKTHFSKKGGFTWERKKFTSKLALMVKKETETIYIFFLLSCPLELFSKLKLSLGGLEDLKKLKKKSINAQFWFRNTIFYLNSMELSRIYTRAQKLAHISYGLLHKHP